MGWTDSHLYEFRFAGDAAFGIPDPDYLSDTSDARKTTLRAALEDCGGKSFHYVCDFGDYWDHVVTIERIEAGMTGFPYPSLLTATGRCPARGCRWVSRLCRISRSTRRSGPSRT